MASRRPCIGIVHRFSGSHPDAVLETRRLARSLRLQGHSTVLFTDPASPSGDGFDRVFRLPGARPLAFADDLAHLRPREECDVLLSLERVWDCDVYRIDHLPATAAALPPPAFRSRRVRSDAAHEEAVLERHLFSPAGPARLIAPSEMVKFEVVHHHERAPEDIHVIPPGYRRPALQGDPRSRFRREWAVTPQETVILFADPGSPWQREILGSAVRAVRELRPRGVRLLVTGTEQTARFGPGAVTRIDWPAGPPVPFEAADLLLSPAWRDPFSRTCLAASAHGLPVVTTVTNGFAEVIRHGIHGDVVRDPGDVEALARSLEGWLDARRRQEARTMIRRRAEAFHVRICVESIRKLLLS